jgi:hypothetical protein
VPPASTTPAWASTGSISGVRARASAASPVGRLDHAHQARPSAAPAAAPSPAAEATVRIVPSTGRTTARRASSEAWVMASTSVGAHAGLRRPRHALAHAPQELGEDDARVPPGPHERAVPDGLADLGQPGAGLDALQLG